MPKPIETEMTRRLWDELSMTSDQLRDVVNPLLLAMRKYGIQHVALETCGPQFTIALRTITGAVIEGWGESP